LCCELLSAQKSFAPQFPEEHTKPIGGINTLIALAQWVVKKQGRLLAERLNRGQIWPQPRAAGTDRSADFPTSVALRRTGSPQQATNRTGERTDSAPQDQQAMKRNQFRLPVRQTGAPRKSARAARISESLQ